MLLGYQHLIRRNTSIGLQTNVLQKKSTLLVKKKLLSQAKRYPTLSFVKHRSTSLSTDKKEVFIFYLMSPSQQNCYGSFSLRMGCCCDEDDEDVLKYFMNSHFSCEENLGPSSLTPSQSSSTVISPMNSHFSALSCRDLLRIIFEKLPIPDLARASCVCRVWKSVASEKEIVTKAFLAPWKLKNVIGNPLSGSFWRDNGLEKFAISHRIVRGDSVASLAVKYSVQVMNIKRLNNMMSDHGIYSRERLLIPVSNPDILINRTCYIELDVYAKREVAVLYPDDIPDGSNNYLSNKLSSEEGRKRVIDSLKRSMQVDDETAQYYWSVSNGDPRAALSEFSEDLRWERQRGPA